MAHPTGVLADGTKVLLGRGAVYFDRLNSSGIRTGEQFLGNCSSFELSTTEETQDFYSSVDAASALISQVATKRTIELNVTMNEFNQYNMGIALMGDPLSIVNGSGTVSAGAETITPTGGAIQGRWYALAHRNVSAVVVKVAAATKTITTDYLLDTVVGRVYIVVGGGISAADVVTADYTYSAETKLAVAGGNSSSVKGMFRFVGDPSSGPVVECQIWNAQVHPDGNLALIGTDFAEFKFKAGVLADVTHPTEPYYRVFTR